MSTEPNTDIPKVKKRRTGATRLLIISDLHCGHLAGLTPPDVEITAWDDRIEDIDYDAPVDLAAISVKTHSARRAYQVAAEYRRRGVPVSMN